MSHPNAELLKKLYSDFSQGDLNAVVGACSDEIKFAVPGKGPLAGTYTKANVIPSLFNRVSELSGGSLKLAVHDILASDQHACVLGSVSLLRKGDKIEYRTCHIWRFNQGKPVAWYIYSRDLDQFDTIWAAVPR